jgi:hypothetical protein
MAATIFLQNTIFTSFIFPFFLVWLIAFGILQKTNILGEKQAQLNALISLVIGFILISAFNYSAVINNLVLFLSIGLVIVFVTFLLWGFVSGGESRLWDPKAPGAIRMIMMIVLFIAIIVGVFWAFGISLGSVSNLLFNQVWSQTFWTNLIFIVLIGLALAVVLAASKGGGGK